MQQSLVEDEYVWCTRSSLINHFGYVAASFLSQINYWLKKQSCGVHYEGKKWIYNTSQEWAKQLHCGESSIRRAITQLRKSGVISVKKLSSDPRNRTNYFCINQQNLDLIVGSTKEVRLKVIPDASAQNERMYNDTKTTNKEINKSEELSPEQIAEDKEKQVELVKQVKKIKIGSQKNSKIDSNRISPEHGVTTSSQFSKVTRPEEISSQKAPLITPKTSTAQDMLRIWNEVLGEKTKASMSKELAPLLVSAHGKKFEKNLEQWKTYCSLIKSSSYLMGDRFQLSIFWALKFSTIDRIRSGNWGVSVEAMKENSDASVVNGQQVEVMIENLSESEKAKETRRKIAKAVGIPMYLSWFHQAQLADREGGIQLIAPNSFVEQYWETHFDWLYKKQL